MPNDTIKLKIEFPRIEIALGSTTDSRREGPFIAVAMLHLREGEVLYQPLMAKPGQGSPLSPHDAADLLAEIYDFICLRWDPPEAH